MTTTIRLPSLSVTLNAVPLSDVMSARVQLGFNMQIAEATVVLRALPAGITPWDIIAITMGGTVGTAALRFTGFFVSADNQFYPKETTLHCKGKLAAADFFRTTTNIDMSTHPGNPGHKDEVMVSTVLAICNVSDGWVPSGEDHMPSIEGTGQLLGHYSWDWGFEWNTDETGLSFINRLDDVCLGYRTYDTAGGTITRSLISSMPTGAAVATFTEGVDIFRATETTTIIDMRNRVVVSGWPGQDNKTEIEYIAEAGNPYLIYFVDNSQWFLTEKFSSNMIEFELTADKPVGYGLSCEEVANWKLHELNEYKEKVILTTPLDTVINPNDVIAVDSPTRLGISTRKFWVQEVDVEINRAGAFSQVLTCVTGIPIYQGYIIAVVVNVTIPAVTATYLGELSATVAPMIVNVTIPAVTATVQSTATVAPIVINVTIPAVTCSMATVVAVVINVTIPAVTGTYLSELSATVTPAGISVTIPAVTGVDSGTYEILLESGDIVLLESGDKLLKE